MSLQKKILDRKNIVITISAIFLIAIILFLFKDLNNVKIDFNTEIRPILNTKCISCHGGVKESSGFSLFSREDALKIPRSGLAAIIPGDPEGSELIKRLLNKDPEERMPYHAEPLSTDEIDKLKTWIKQGAHWQDHWAYLKPVKPTIPNDPSGWAANPIDNFIKQKLNQEGLQQSVKADKATLLRRLSLDIIGLPPTEKEFQDFKNDYTSNAYEKQVNRLLASPHFGEKWASMWLDLARYSDSKGYEKDQQRNIWKFRDYVIKSFNDDKPFDQFTMEQLAGDLLHNPSENQLIATAFHRNTANNDEGGTDDEEFRTSSTIDRNNNTWETWQGVTMGCVQCHSHPYDPFRHEDFYKSLAYFNNTRDEDIPLEYPNLINYQKEDSLKIENIKNWISRELSKRESESGKQFISQLLKVGEPKIHAHSFDSLTNAAMIDGKWLAIGHNGFARLKKINLSGISQILLSMGSEHNKGVLEIRRDKKNGEIIGRLQINKGTSLWDSKNYKKILVPIKKCEGIHQLFFSCYNPTFKNPQDYVMSIEYFLALPNFPGKGKPGFQKVNDSIIALLNKGNTDNTPIMQENSKDFRRKNFVFVRGNWTSKGAEVQPGTPGFMPGIKNNEPSRLGLAKWIIDKNNPLTARVAVNRFWEQLFGTGIVETLEDFGSQGAKPSHPELLDFLAITFRDDYKWSIKKILKLIVMSNTYQQTSVANKNVLQKDPTNKFLARGPRVRLSAEEVRDQALAVSGLLSLKIYGKSVMPPQPNGVWQVVYSGMEWKTSQGENAFRRAIYTFWRRSSPYPSMMTFDASSREICQSRRIRTNTPLQALVTLNDTVYIVAARGLAERAMKESKGNVKNKIEKAYQIALLKDINEQKISVLNKLYEQSFKYYSEKPGEAEKILGISDRHNKTENIEKASLTVVANAIMNLDGFVMKE